MRLRRRPRRQVSTCLFATLLGAALLGAAAVTGCGPSPAASPPADLVAPLDTVAAGPQGAWAVLAMGRLDDPNNTFWQAFYRAPGASSWALRTPTDVADNGGLVIATTGARLVVGVVPSNQLRFSPLALSSDHGGSYTPGLLPYGLTHLPDVLATAPDGSAYALTTTGLLASGPSLMDWHPVLALPATAPATRHCGVTDLSAVAATPGGVALGVGCATPGAVGIFDALTGGPFHDVSPTLPTGRHPGTVRILRLVSTGQGLAALLGQGGPAASITAAWADTALGPWTLSAPLPAGSIASTSVTATGTFTVLLRRADGTMQVSTTAPQRATWATLPTPPPGTAAVAIDGARVDVLAVDVTRFTDYQLLAGRWVDRQTVTVPIPFGSSG